MKKPELDNVIKYSNEDGTIASGHLGGNENPLKKYLPIKQTSLKKTKNVSKRSNKK